jgi:hypothetical protein
MIARFLVTLGVLLLTVGIIVQTASAQADPLPSWNDGPTKQRIVAFVDDHEGKPVGVSTFIGRRPILAFGNSDGDQQMLEYTDSGLGPRLMLLVHHDDAEREYAYDRRSHVGKLDIALDEAQRRDWVVISMKNDWQRVFP